MTGLDFVAVDVETANARRGSVCALGLAVVQGGQVTDTHSWLCRPPEQFDHFDPHNIAIHGIHPEHVAGEPPFHQRMSEALAVIGDRPVVAHNAAFDVGALREACDAEGLRWPTLRYGCTLVWSRRELQLANYRLPTVAGELGISLERHHEASEDAAACAQILLALAGKRGSRTVEDFATTTGTRLGTLTSEKWRGCGVVPTSNGRGDWIRRDPDIPPANTEADPAHPLYGQVVVITGDLSISRQEAWSAVAETGGIPNKDVTKRTTHLVIGDGFTGGSLDGFTTGKVTKALTWQSKGQKIEILTEAEFTALLTGRSTSENHQGMSG
ncbi:DNA polymerase-3 subunit epsilon [Halopolyspora algeriensis]|uniref:DNA polymerase-3 subunit epsilon n=1 Tax=Halopolyspora algeriensis TaxID=1500506 RepID=A0A368VIB1_9ACTN|nr:exonuclease domain-containing protein [Halopolyspora algeriensis]RCW41025.1 DNA polymerase-3 subunit epsilon [Halopolyspora algeriensis]TQM53891.1 DNA polymerase-3 subunit epsilon [Halopolyspora algeriensis]